MSDLTKMELWRGLNVMLKKKPLNKITINDIVSECGLNRMTFYYHFHDIYDLIDWAWEKISGDIIGEDFSYDRWQVVMLDILIYIQNDRTNALNIFRNVDYRKVEEFVYGKIYPRVVGYLDSLSENMNISDENKAFVASFYTHALIGVSADWAKRKFKDDPHEIVGKLNLILDENVKRVLQQFDAKS